MFGKTKKGEVSPISLDKVDGERPADDLGKFPAEVDLTPSRTKAQERALRAVSLVATVSALMNVALVMLVITLFPLHKVTPFLVTFKSQENQVVAIEPMDVDAPGIVFATEDSIRDYVTQRHRFTPNSALMDAQWGGDSRLAARTGNELYGKFVEASKTEMTQMMAAGYDRQVEINSVQRLSTDTWQVNFTTNDSLPTSGGTLTGNNAYGSQPSTSGIGTPGSPSVPVVSQTQQQSWIATMRIDYQPQSVTYDKRLLNPLGFTVLDYSVTRNARS